MRIPSNSYMAGLPSTTRSSQYPVGNLLLLPRASSEPQFGAQKGGGKKGGGGGFALFLAACAIGGGLVVHSNADSDSSTPPSASSSAKKCSWTDIPLSHRFQRAITEVLRYEGGYNPDDPGGSMYGISYDPNAKALERCYRIHPGQIRTLQKEQAEHLYYEFYWKASGADKIKDPGLQLFHFDTAVNMGIQTAKDLYSNDLTTYWKNRRKQYEKYGKTDRNRPYLNGWLSRADDMYKKARSWG